MKLKNNKRKQHSPQLLTSELSINPKNNYPTEETLKSISVKLISNVLEAIKNAPDNNGAINIFQETIEIPIQNKQIPIKTTKNRN